MTYTLAILYFLFYSFAGWIIDSISCSITQKKWVNSGYFHELPLCPMYGVGGLILFLLMKHTQSFPPVIAILLGILVVNLVEYVGGVFCILFLKERLWDYSHRKWHLHGHIDLFHAVCWSILVIVYYYYLFPTLLTIDEYFIRILVVPPTLDIFTLWICVIGTLILTLSRRHHRLRTYQKSSRKKRRYLR